MIRVAVAMFVVIAAATVTQADTATIVITAETVITDPVPPPNTPAYRWPVFSPHDCPVFTSDGSITDRVRYFSPENYPIAFDDPTPRGARVVSMRVLISAAGSCTRPPTLGVYVWLPFRDGNSYKIGESQAVNATCFTPGVCPSGVLSGYAFESERYETGLPDYRYGGANELYPGRNWFVVDSSDDASTPVWERIEITLTYLPPPRVEFDITSATTEMDRRVLTKARRGSSEYFSRYQRDLAGERDARMLIEGTLVYRETGASLPQPIPNTRVWLRLYDPPDTSPYVPLSSRTSWDNIDPKAGINDSFATSVITDQNGRFSAVLHTSQTASGDNYQVEGSVNADIFMPFVPCTPQTNCSRSGVITSWKRQYIEQDFMARRGAFVDGDNPAGSRQVNIHRMQGVQFQPQMQIVLLRSPRNGSGSSAPFYISQSYTIVQVRPDRLTLDRPIDVDLYGALRQQDMHLGDAVAIIGDPAGDVYEAYSHLVQPLFRDAFVEYELAGPEDNTLSRLPYMRQPTDDEKAQITQRWFEMATYANTQYLVGADRDDGNRRMGATSHAGNWSFIFATEIRDRHSDPRLNAEVTAHEITHQWQANVPAGYAGDHCDQPTCDPNDGTRYCIMKAVMFHQGGNLNGVIYPEFYDGVVMFHYLPPTQPGGLADSEYVQIRARSDTP